MTHTLESFRNACPAAFADVPAPHVSDRYVFVRTADVVERLVGAGFSVDTAQQVKATRRSPEHGLHRVKLSHPEARLHGIGGLVPQMLLTNSHNHASRFEATVGLFRLICTNGMVVGATWATVSFRHQRSSAFDVGDLLAQFVEKTHRIGESVSRWEGITLSDSQSAEYARRVAAIRFPNRVLERPDELLVSHRVEDNLPTLWHTFNRAQENGTHGGTRFAGMRRRARALSGITADQQYNTALWSLTDAFADEVTAG
jgi:hypothetical protein